MQNLIRLNPLFLNIDFPSVFLLMLIIIQM